MLQSERLRQAIENSGLTYEKLGQLTGIAKSSIQRYASGNTKKIPVDAISSLAPHLRVPATHLMGWEELPDTDAAVDAIASNINEKTLTLHESTQIKKYRALDERGQGVVDNILDYEYNMVVEAAAVKKGAG